VEGRRRASWISCILKQYLETQLQVLAARRMFY
jgi:hypothetical protein